MDTHRNEGPGNCKLALVAAIVALTGQAAILFNDFGAGNNSRNSDSAWMITAVAVSDAGAIETWPEQAPHFTRAMVDSPDDR